MAKLLFVLFWAVGLTWSFQDTCGSPQRPQWGYDEQQNLVCYEHVRVISIHVGLPPVRTPNKCHECAYDLDSILAEIECYECVTAIEPGTSNLIVPETTIFTGSDGRPTVILYTPVLHNLNPAPTVTIPYTGDTPITAPATRIYRPSGTLAPTVVVETPEPTALGDHDTTTVPDTSTPPLTKPITQTIPPVDGERGTIIEESPTSSCGQVPAPTDEAEEEDPENLDEDEDGDEEECPEPEHTDTVPEPESTDTLPELEPTGTVPELEPTDTLPELEPTGTVPELEPTDTLIEPEPIDTVLGPESTSMDPELEPTDTLPEPESTSMDPELEPTGTDPEPESTSSDPEPEPTDTVPELESTSMDPEPESTDTVPELGPTDTLPEPESTSMDPEPESTSRDPELEPTDTVPEPVSTDEDSEPTRTNTPSGPTFDCDVGGYLIQRRTLYRLDLATGDNPAVNTRVGPGGNINAMGFNILDGYLYAFVSIGNGQQQLIRIGADGSSDLLDLIVQGGLNVGDVDEAGKMWASDGGRRWIQVDLDPDSRTFGEQVDEGVSPNGNVADWVYLERGGDYLYSIRLGATDTAARWSRTTHLWENLRDYQDSSQRRRGFGGLYAVGDELWGSDNQSGDIIAFPVLDEDQDARKISNGPSTSSNDGARCFQAPAPET